MPKETHSTLEVPLLDLKRQYLSIKDELDEAVLQVVSSQQFILGSRVEACEAKIAEYVKTPYACGVSSGTDALLLSLMAEGIGPGDEVITSTYTFFATAGSVVRTGARPVFVDIDPLTYNINPDLITEKITPKTKAIVPVHLYGQVADMDPILALARNHDLAVIEDAAQAIGARYRRHSAGSMGDYGCFSFFPTKNLGGFGDGGMVVSRSSEKMEKVRILRVHGGYPKYHHSVIGGNFRLDALQAAVISVKLRYLDAWSEKRRENAIRYECLFRSSGFADGKAITLPRVKEERHIFNQYVIRASRRDALMQYLKDKKIGCEIYYPIPLHLQECFRDLGYGQGDFPESEKAAQETLAIPVYPELTEEQQAYVVETIREFYRK